MTYTKNAGRMLDESLLLMDSTTAVTADALATVGGAAANGIIDIGDVDAFFEVVLDLATVTVAGTNNEIYNLQILGSDSSSFASGIVILGEVRLGDKDALAGGTGGVDTNKGAGRYRIGVSNRIGSSTYRYVRLNIEVAGTSPSITFGPDGAFIAQVFAA